jgi:predicted DNA-binding transcriptional regulator AlpA
MSIPTLRTAEPDTEAPTADPFAGRLTLRLNEVASALGVSRRAIERERSAGRFPRPDRTIGKMPIWSVETIRQWIEGGGHR